MESLAQRNDIIIKCPLEEMVKSFFKDYEVVWHDPNLLNTQENHQYQAQLEQFCQIQCFTEWEKALIYLQETKKICHVITSGTNGELLVKEIDAQENVSNIYVFCKNKDYHLIWTKNYPKIACVEADIVDILNQIQQKLLEFYSKTSSLTFNLPAFAPIFNLTHKSHMNNLHRFLKVIPNFENREQAKKDFIALSNGIYSDQKNKSEIAHFERNYNEYNMGSVLKWYSRDSFFYRVTNNSLRIATSDSIQYCRFALKDVERAIKEQYQLKSKNFNGELFRGAYLSQEEWSNLKENVGKEIEMHGFMSASKEKKIALNFVKGDVSAKVFITIVVPKGPNDEEQGFADLYEFSEFPVEKEVLFNVRSRFTVLEIEEHSKELKCRHLVLLYGAQSFRKFVTEKNCLQQVFVPEDVSGDHCSAPNSEFDGKVAFLPITNPPSHNYHCKKCLPDFIKSSTTPLYCHRVNSNSLGVKIIGFLLEKRDVKIPFYGYQCSKCLTKGGKFYYVCAACHEKRRNWCGNCVEDISECLRLDHTVILETTPFSFWFRQMSQNELKFVKFQSDSASNGSFFQQPQMFEESHEYKKAIEYYKIYSEQNAHSPDEKLAECYNNFGKLYHQQTEYQKAHEYLDKALKIREEIHGENHLDVAISYSNRGNVFISQGRPEEALEDFYQAFNIRRSIFGENDDNRLEFADSYSDIATAYSYQANVEHAENCFQKSLEILKSIYGGEKHSSVANVYCRIGDLYLALDEYKMARDYFFKSLKVRKLLYGEIHDEVAFSYMKIGDVYKLKKNFEKAKEYYDKAFEIWKSVYGENHPHVAMCYENIGRLLQRKGEYESALEKHIKSLEIRKSVYEEIDPFVAVCYEDIGKVWDAQGKYEVALENHKKALEIRTLYPFPIAKFFL